LEPPAAPDKPYSPSPIFDSAIVGFMVLVLSSAFVVPLGIIERMRAPTSGGPAK